MTEDEMRREMRLTAIEFLLTTLYRNYYRSVGASSEMVLAEHRRLLDHLETDPWGDDPAMSDMLSDEFRSAVAALLGQIEEKMTGG